MKRTVRWGIVGLGNIAKQFASDLKLVSDGELIAVGSRNLDKAKEFAMEHVAKYTFGSYLEVFECDEVDIIYIATPHTSHATLSIQAMDHGKHVLCEKPLGLNLAEVEEMIASSIKNNVFLMEALWSRFNPTIRKTKQLIEEGQIGDIGYLHADFAFYALQKSEEGRLLNPDLAGGSLLDIGIYPVFLAYLILGYPDKILSASNFYKTGVEIQSSMIFVYSNAHAILYSGLSSKSEMKAEISGNKGAIFIHPRWHESQGYSIEKDGSIENFQLPARGKGYTHEIEEVHDCLINEKTESGLWSHQNSQDLIRLLDHIRKQSDIVFPSEV